MAGKLSKQQIYTMAMTALDRADGWEGDELAQNMADALDYYNGVKPSPPGDGQSDVVSFDVADMVEAVLANMVPSITSDSSVSFQANGEQDDSQVDAESDAVNTIIHDHNDGFMLFLESIKDALLIKVGIIKVFVERKETVRRDSFSGLSDVEVLQVLEPLSEQETVEVGSDVPGENGGRDLSVKYTTRTVELRLKAVDPVNFRIAASWDQLALRGCPFVSETHYLRRSQLLSLGFPRRLIDELPASEVRTEIALARSFRRYVAAGDNRDKSQETVEVHQCFMTMDRDGDGIEELIEVWIGNGGEPEPLSMTDVDYIPYAIGSPFIAPHRAIGYSLYDKVGGVQDVKTEALRQWLDNAANANVGRTEAVINQVNMDDLADKRQGGVVRVKAPGMIRDLPITDIGASMQTLLNYQDKIRSERGGASLDLQSASGQIAGDTAAGIERQYSAREQMAGLMIRTLAMTLIKQTYLLVHATARSQMTGKIRFKRSGDWVVTDPASWPERKRVDVKIGTSPNERARRSANLEKIVAYQMQILQMGADGIMADLPGVYAAVKDWARSSSIDSPEQYFIDPSSKQAQATQQKKAQAAQAAAQKAEQQQQQMIALQMQLAQAQLTAEQIKVIIETQFKYFDAVLSSEVEEAKILKDVMSGQLQTLQGAGVGQAAELGQEANNGARMASGN